MEPDPRRRSEHLETQVLEDGLMQSHFCKWARTSPAHKALASEIEVILGIRYVRKHSWEDDSELSGKALQQHVDMVQAYREILHSRIDSCVEEELDLAECLQLLRRLWNHVQRHLELQYRGALVEAALREQLDVPASVCEAIHDPQLVAIVQQVVQHAEDVQAVEWYLHVHERLHEEDCARCPRQLLHSIKPYIQRTVTPFHRSHANSAEGGNEKETFIRLFDHIESEMNLAVKLSVGSFKRSSEFAQLRAKQICDPERVDTMRQQVLMLKSKGISTMVFDFDKTLVPTHTGTMHVSDVEALRLMPVARLLLFTGLSEGLRMAVASFSDPGDRPLEAGHVCGENLIRMVLDHEDGLGKELSALVRIVAGHPEKMHKRGVPCACGHAHPLPYSKHHHLHSLCPELARHEMRPSSVMLFDDNMGNTVRARQEGLTGADVDPETAFTWETWGWAVQDAEHIPEPDEEPPWSFERVQQ